MGVCVFVASGLNFRMDDFLRKNPFQTTSKFYKGAVLRRDLVPRPDTGFTVLLGQDEDPTLQNQAQQAIRFLLKNERELEAMKEFGADNLLLDFGFAPPAQLQSSVYLPPELLLGMARFRLGLIFSVVQLPRG
jgi:hypothetical protein